MFGKKNRGEAEVQMKYRYNHVIAVRVFDAKYNKDFFNESYVFDSYMESIQAFHAMQSGWEAYKKGEAESILFVIDMIKEPTYIDVSVGEGYTSKDISIDICYSTREVDDELKAES